MHSPSQQSRVAGRSSSNPGTALAAMWAPCDSLEGGKVSREPVWFPWASGGGLVAGYRTLGRVSPDKELPALPERGAGLTPREAFLPWNNRASNHGPRAQPVPPQWPLRAREEEWFRGQLSNKSPWQWPLGRSWGGNTTKNLGLPLRPLGISENNPTSVSYSVSLEFQRDPCGLELAVPGLPRWPYPTPSFVPTVATCPQASPFLSLTLLATAGPRGQPSLCLCSLLSKNQGQGWGGPSCLRVWPLVK